MKIDEDIAKLICELEFIIGDQCYNPSSYNGYTGDEGCSFRYPVYAYTNESPDDLVKLRGRLNKDFLGTYLGIVTPELVRAMRYKFGANHLYIGEAIYNVLIMLEKRYGISFNDLEANHLKKESEK